MNKNEFYQYILKDKDAQIDGLKQLISSLVDKIDTLEADVDSYKSIIKELRDTNNLLNKKLYGSKSEKSHTDKDSDDNEQSTARTCHEEKEEKLSEPQLEDIKQIKRSKPYKRPDRRKYDDIEEKIEILEPDSKELEGAKFVRSEKTFRLYLIPSKIVKVIYDRRIYAKDGHLVIPPLPYVPEEFHKRHADPSLMAGILANKFYYHLPINRQVTMFNHAGANIARSTLYDWCGIAIDALEGLYQTIREEVLKGDYINIDETTVSVIDEDVHHVKKEYMWGLVDTQNKLTFFAYEDGSRSKTVINDILEGYIGTIQTDGYSAYKSIGNANNNKIKRLSCLCHIRRKFCESKENDPKHSKEALTIINKIYRLEKCFRKLKLLPDKIKEYRIRFTIPLFQSFKQWLKENIVNPKILDETLIGKAVSYAYKEFEALTHLFDNGFFKPDNNAAERGLRPTKLGLNNYLFFGNHKNARRGAIIYTIVESCKLNRINVFDYLTEIFSKEPKDGETYEMFLPNKWGK